MTNTAMQCQARRRFEGKAAHDFINRKAMGTESEGSNHHKGKPHLEERGEGKKRCRSVKGE